MGNSGQSKKLVACGNNDSRDRAFYLSCCCSVDKLSDCLQPHELQLAGWLSSPLSPGGCSNSCSLSRWYYLTILSSASSSFFCLRSFLASGSFPMSYLFTSGGQSTGASASASILPMNIQGWFPLRLSGLTDPCCPRDSQESCLTPQFKSINSSVTAYNSIYKVPHNLHMSVCSHLIFIATPKQWVSMKNLLQLKFRKVAICPNYPLGN